MVNSTFNYMVMALVLDEDTPVSMQVYSTAPGYQSMVLRGMMTKQEGGVTYATPLLPQMFYGADGTQLGPSWRQYIPSAGAQTILSRSGGLPALPPDEELFWRKVSEPKQVDTPVVSEVAVSPLPAIAVVIVAGAILWWLTKNG